VPQLGSRTEHTSGPQWSPPNTTMLCVAILFLLSPFHLVVFLEILSVCCSRAVKLEGGREVEETINK
jgi:hypothetical protein